LQILQNLFSLATQPATPFGQAPFCILGHFSQAIPHTPTRILKPSCKYLATCLFMVFVFFLFYVGEMVLAVPQNCNWGRLLFGNAMCFSVCYGVAEEFFFTRPAWLYAQASEVWLWKHVSLVFSSQESTFSNESIEQHNAVGH
jgi:hypothetical protein